jgi:hypothetical protein
MNQVVGPREHLTVLDAFSGKEHKEAVNQYYEEIFVRLPQNTQRAYNNFIILLKTLLFTDGKVRQF